MIHDNRGNYWIEHMQKSRKAVNTAMELLKADYGEMITSAIQEGLLPDPSALSDDLREILLQEMLIIEGEPTGMKLYNAWLRVKSKTDIPTQFQQCSESQLDNEFNELNSGTQPPDPPALPLRLTERQLEVANLCALSVHTDEIAKRLNISKSTAKNHLTAIREMLKEYLAVDGTFKRHDVPKRLAQLGYGRTESQVERNTKE